MLIYLIPNVMTVFTLVTTVSAILFMFVWTIILCSYLVYRKRRPALHKIHLQNASRYFYVMGLYGVFRLCFGTADIGK